MDYTIHTPNEPVSERLPEAASARSISAEEPIATAAECVDLKPIETPEADCCG